MKLTSNPLAEDLDHILDHTRSLWEELRGERLFLTGGTGFFGCWLLESLLWANDRLGLDCRVTVLTRTPEAFQAKAPHLARHPILTLLQGDIRTFEYPSGTFSHLIHAATESSARLNAEQPLLMLDTIIEGTRHALKFSRSCGTKRFLLTSSGAVYGRQPPGLRHIPEDYPGAPDPTDSKSAYGQGKRLAEHLCILYGRDSGIEMKIARCFALIGPYLPLDIHFAIGNFLRDALNGGPIIVQGDGTPRRSYLYASDLAIWLWTILLDGRSRGPYNVGSEESFSIAEVAQAVARVAGRGIRIEIRGTPNPASPPEQYVPSTRRAREELQLSPSCNLDQGIRRTLRWLTARPY